MRPMIKGNGAASLVEHDVADNIIRPATRPTIPTIANKVVVFLFFSINIIFIVSKYFVLTVDKLFDLLHLILYLINIICHA